MKPRVAGVGALSKPRWRWTFQSGFSISLPPCSLVCVCFACVCVCLVSQVYRDHIKGWSAMAVTRLCSFFVVFFLLLIFPFIFDQGGFVSLSAPVRCPQVHWGWTRVHTSSALHGFSSRLLLAGILSVSQNDAASEGWRWGLRGQPKWRCNFILSMERDGGQVCVCLSVCFKCMRCV